MACKGSGVEIPSALRPAYPAATLVCAGRAACQPTEIMPSARIAITGQAAGTSVGPDRELVGPLVVQHELAVPARDVQHQPTGDSLALVQRQLIKVEERVEPAPGDFP
jgi:hypothetical protein